MKWRCGQGVVETKCSLLCRLPGTRGRPSVLSVDVTGMFAALGSIILLISFHDRSILHLAITSVSTIPRDISSFTTVCIKVHWYTVVRLCTLVLPYFPEADLMHTVTCPQLGVTTLPGSCQIERRNAGQDKPWAMTELLLLADRLRHRTRETSVNAGMWVGNVSFAKFCGEESTHTLGKKGSMWRHLWALLNSWKQVTTMPGSLWALQHCRCCQSSASVIIDTSAYRVRNESDKHRVRLPNISSQSVAAIYRGSLFRVVAVCSRGGMVRRMYITVRKGRDHFTE